jgi:hypothetical protein
MKLILLMLMTLASRGRAADFIGVTSNVNLPNELVTLHTEGETVNKTELANLGFWKGNSAAYSTKRNELFIMTRESTTTMAMTIIGYDAKTGKPTGTKVPIADKKLSSFYALFYDDVEDDLKCILMENATAAYSVNISTGEYKLLATLKPKSAEFELGASSFDQATGTLYQLQAAVGFLDLFAVDTRSMKPTATKIRTSLTINQYFMSPVFSVSHGKLFGFSSMNELGSIDPATGKHEKIGAPVAKGNVDFSSNHVALDDAAGVIYTTVSPDDRLQSTSVALSHFMGVSVETGKVVLKKATASPLMYLHLVA